MDSNKITFESQSLNIDCISFKFQQLEKFIKEPILLDYYHRLAVCFVKNNSSRGWNFLNFSGFNVSKFYFLCQERKIDWNILAFGVLSSLDFYYRRAKQR